MHCSLPMACGGEEVEGGRIECVRFGALGGRCPSHLNNHSRPPSPHTHGQKITTRHQHTRATRAKHTWRGVLGQEYLERNTGEACVHAPKSCRRRKRHTLHIQRDTLKKRNHHTPSMHMPHAWPITQRPMDRRGHDNERTRLHARGVPHHHHLATVGTGRRDTPTAADQRAALHHARP